MNCCIVGCMGALMGRLAVFILWITGWFSRADVSFVWVVVGFFFAPLTVICVGCVNVYFGGHWGFWQVVAVIFCLLTDLGGDGSPAARRRNRG